VFRGGQSTPGIITVNGGLWVANVEGAAMGYQFD
jgi:hypothetical protein